MTCVLSTSLLSSKFIIIPLPETSVKPRKFLFSFNSVSFMESISSSATACFLISSSFNSSVSNCLYEFLYLILKMIQTTHQLTQAEIKMLGFEFSPEFLKKQILIMQESVNVIFKNFIKLAKFLSNKNDAGKRKLETLKKLSEDIIRTENDYLEFKANVSKILQVTRADLNNTRIFFQFKDENEKNNFLNQITQRKDYLITYQANLDILEKLNEKINSVIEKVTLSSALKGDS